MANYKAFLSPEERTRYNEDERRAMEPDDDCGYQVELFVYDLTRGLARTLSPTLLGKQIEGVWHTGVVVYGREYFFGSAGIESCKPGGTILGDPDRIEVLGESQVPYQLFLEYIFGLGESTYKPGAYDLLKHNCNNFSDDIAQFLCGRGVPNDILQLPEEILNTPIGLALNAKLKEVEFKHSDSRSINFAPLSSSFTGPAIQIVRSSYDDPEFDELNQAIDQVRHNSVILEERRNSINDKLSKKERKQRRKEKRERKEKRRKERSETSEERRLRKKKNKPPLPPGAYTDQVNYDNYNHSDHCLEGNYRSSSLDYRDNSQNYRSGSQDLRRGRRWISPDCALDSHDYSHNSQDYERDSQELRSSHNGYHQSRRRTSITSEREDSYSGRLNGDLNTTLDNVSNLSLADGVEDSVSGQDEVWQPVDDFWGSQNEDSITTVTRPSVVEASEAYNEVKPTLQAPVPEIRSRSNVSKIDDMADEETQSQSPAAEVIPEGDRARESTPEPVPEVEREPPILYKDAIDVFEDTKIHSKLNFQKPRTSSLSLISNCSSQLSSLCSLACSLEELNDADDTWDEAKHENGRKLCSKIKFSDNSNNIAFMNTFSEQVDNMDIHNKDNNANIIKLNVNSLRENFNNGQHDNDDRNIDNLIANLIHHDNLPQEQHSDANINIAKPLAGVEKENEQFLTKVDSACISLDDDTKLKSENNDTLNVQLKASLKASEQMPDSKIRKVLAKSIEEFLRRTSTEELRKQFSYLAGNTTDCVKFVGGSEFNVPLENARNGQGIEKVSESVNAKSDFKSVKENILEELDVGSNRQTRSEIKSENCNDGKKYFSSISIDDRIATSNALPFHYALETQSTNQASGHGWSGMTYQPVRYAGGIIRPLPMYGVSALQQNMIPPTAPRIAYHHPRLADAPETLFNRPAQFSHPILTPCASSRQSRGPPSRNDQFRASLRPGFMGARQQTNYPWQQNLTGLQPMSLYFNERGCPIGPWIYTVPYDTNLSNMYYQEFGVHPCAQEQVDTASHCLAQKLNLSTKKIFNSEDTTAEVLAASPIQSAVYDHSDGVVPKSLEPKVDETKFHNHPPESYLCHLDQDSDDVFSDCDRPCPVESNLEDRVSPDSSEQHFLASRDVSSSSLCRSSTSSSSMSFGSSYYMLYVVDPIERSKTPDDHLSSPDTSPTPEKAAAEDDFSFEQVVQKSDSVSSVDSFRTITPDPEYFDENDKAFRKLRGLLGNSSESVQTDMNSEGSLLTLRKSATSDSKEDKSRSSTSEIVNLAASKHRPRFPKKSLKRSRKQAKSLPSSPTRNIQRPLMLRGCSLESLYSSILHRVPKLSPFSSLSTLALLEPSISNSPHSVLFQNPDRPPSTDSPVMFTDFDGRLRGSQDSVVVFRPLPRYSERQSSASPEPIDAILCFLGPARPVEPPIIFKDKSREARHDFDELVGAAMHLLSPDEQSHMEELRAYIVEDDGAWALGENFGQLFARIFQDTNIPEQARYYLVRILAVAALKDDVILLLHQDRKDHTIMNFINRVEHLSPQLQEAIALFFCNMFEHLSPSEWLLYISEWTPEGSTPISNIRVTTKVAVNALLHTSDTVVEYGTALMYNLGTKEVKTVVFDDVAPELAMAILQYLNKRPDEEHLWRTLTALCRFCYASSEVPSLIKMIGPEPSTFKGVSERIDTVIDEISVKLSRVRLF